MANSETILSEHTHPNDSTTQTVVGNIYKGDGYYSRADGFHTVQITVNDLIGTVTIQATLATVPSEVDWFDVLSHVATDNSPLRSGSFIYNFTGNYVWIRAKLVYTDGTLNTITLNH